MDVTGDFGVSLTWSFLNSCLMGMDLISIKVHTKDNTRKLLYADQLVVVAENKEELPGELYWT